MLGWKETEQQQVELVTYELLVRKDHLLRKIDQTIDFSFIYRLCAPLYSADNRRPAIDPEILFRMLFVGYLYGIMSETRLCEEVEDNVAYRWFCGLGLTEKVPDNARSASTGKGGFRTAIFPNRYSSWAFVFGMPPDAPDLAHCRRSPAPGIAGLVMLPYRHEALPVLYAHGAVPCRGYFFISHAYMHLDKVLPVYGGGLETERRACHHRIFLCVRSASISHYRAPLLAGSA